MLVKDFFKFSNEHFATEMQIMADKGTEYTRSNEDKLHNFKAIGAELDLPAQKVLAVFMKKHQMSIDNFIKIGNVVSDEPIEGRIHDFRNYLMLLQALIAEEKGDG